MFLGFLWREKFDVVWKFLFYKFLSKLVLSVVYDIFASFSVYLNLKIFGGCCICIEVIFDR